MRTALLRFSAQLRTAQPRTALLRSAQVFTGLLLAVALCGCAAGGTLEMVSSSVGAAGSAAAASASTLGSKPAMAGRRSGSAPASAVKPDAGSPATSGSRGGGPAGSSTTAKPKRPVTAPVPTLARSKPVRIQVPAIGVDSGLLDLGLQADGTMEVPPDASSLGWFTGAPTPGELGPAVIVGHVDWAGELGSFYNLGELKPGDDITVTREDGRKVAFKVSKRGEYPKDDFPTDAVYANTDHAALRLITCGGEFDRDTGNYLDNIIVFADMVPARP